MLISKTFPLRLLNLNSTPFSGGNSLTSDCEKIYFKKENNKNNFNIPSNLQINTFLSLNF